MDLFADPVRKVRKMNKNQNKPKSQKQIRNAKPKRSQRNKAQGRNLDSLGFDSKAVSAQAFNLSRAVENTEYIGTINSSNEFVVHRFALNPGQGKVFPWLAKQAQGWEKYKFDKLEFFTKPLISAFNTHAVGAIIAAVEYDASEGPPEDKQAMYTTWPHDDDVPCKPLRLSADPRQMFQSSDARFVRNGVVPPQADIKTYDVGALYVATEGQPDADTPVAEIHVRYRVRFSVPQTDSKKPAGSSVYTMISTPEVHEPMDDDDTEYSVNWSEFPGGALAPIYNGIEGFATDNDYIRLPDGQFLITPQLNFYVTPTEGTLETINQVFIDCKNGSGVSVLPLFTDRLGWAQKITLAGDGCQQMPLVQSFVVTSNSLINNSFLIVAQKRAKNGAGGVASVYISGTCLIQQIS